MKMELNSPMRTSNQLTSAPTLRRSGSNVRLVRQCENCKVLFGNAHVCRRKITFARKAVKNESSRDTERYIASRMDRALEELKELDLHRDEREDSKEDFMYRK